MFSFFVENLISLTCISELVMFHKERRNNMNRVELIGRLTRDPELSYTPNTQTAVASMTIAVDRPKKNGESQGADFIRIKAFGKVAENVHKYMVKGRMISVCGRIQTGSYKNKEGQTVYTTEVVADAGPNGIGFLSGGPRNDSPSAKTKEPENTPAPRQQTLQDIPGTADDDFNDFGGFDGYGDYEEFDA